MERRRNGHRQTLVGAALKGRLWRMECRDHDNTLNLGEKTRDLGETQDPVECVSGLPPDTDELDVAVRWRKRGSVRRSV
jgi:hypothetical protein